MSKTETGLLLLAIAGFMNASFTLPMKFTRRWAWENTWLVFTFFALLLLPAAETLCTVPELASVYRASGVAPLLTVIAFGGGWGIAQIFFGIAVEAIGIALTFSLVLGTSAAVGALIPMLRLNPDKLHTSSGHALLVGLATILLGVAICAVAGTMRDRSASTEGRQHNKATSGLILAILCGCGVSSLNFGLAFGGPLIAAATRHGASTANAGNAVWLPLLGAGAVPNILYCLYLTKRNSSGRNFRGAGFDHWILCLLMGILWFGSVFVYGLSISWLGPLGAAVGWPLFMSLIVVAASLLGILTGEWKRSGRWPIAIQLTGVVMLILAIFILAQASRGMT
jgi:L-rhamnose-H+ transport protein